MNNVLLTFAMALLGSVAKAIAQAATPVLLGVARETGSTIFELAEMELSAEYTAEQKRTAETDAKAFLAETWTVLKQEGALLESDIASLTLLAGWDEIKSLVSP